MSEPELGIHTPEPLSGTVSAACRVLEQEGMRLVLLHGQPAYLYDPRDKPTHRLVWVMVHLHGHARQAEITRALGVGRRTFQYWVKLYREGGAAALQERAKSGAPRKVDSALEKRMLRLREQRASVREIARLCQLSVGKVHAVLRAAEQERAAGQPALPLPEREPPADPEPSAEAAPAMAAPDAPGEPEGSPQRDRAEEAASRDRGTDRLLARLGVLEDAEPLFGSEPRVEWAGALMAMVLWAGCPLLEFCRQAYRSLGPAFYGLRTVLSTLVTMSLLRLHRPERLREQDPVKLGRVLGLDRSPEVKTLRRKVHRLCRREKAAELMARWAEHQVEQSSGGGRVVLIDGHVQVYHGREKIGRVYCNQARRVVKGRTENWVHLPGGTPLLSLNSAFNGSLSAALPEAMGRASALCGGEPITAVFDRGGWSSELFEAIVRQGHHFLTYRKGNFERWGAEAFEPRETVIGQRTCPRAPALRELELAVYEKRGLDPKGRTRYRNTGRKLPLREVRLWREDGGETSILTSRRDLDAVQIATLQLSRWGAQENGFKYLLAEYDLDSLWVYGSQELPQEVDHPDPEHGRVEKQLQGLQARRKELLARIWRQLPREPEGKPTGPALPERIARWAARAGGQKEVRALQELEAQIQEATERLERTPGRESARLGGYRQLKSEAKLLLNLIKMVAFDLETRLCELLAPAYANAEREKRTVIAAALRTTGSLRLAPGELIVQLDPQASPNRTRAVNAVLEQLNRRQARFPGSHRVIRFEPTPCPEPPPNSKKSAPTTTPPHPK